MSQFRNAYVLRNVSFTSYVNPDIEAPIVAQGPLEGLNALIELGFKLGEIWPTGIDWQLCAEVLALPDGTVCRHGVDVESLKSKRIPFGQGPILLFGGDDDEPNLILLVEYGDPPVPNAWDNRTSTKR